MAWYRAGGGGIPSSLKSDMNAVLNKKMGTSLVYPPDEWADTVNLMGKLPEKTVSGAIVTFPDGADAVPLKKCEVSLSASLDGYSEVDVVHCGKNLLENELTTQTVNGTTFTVNSDGSITVSGTPSTQTRVYIASGLFLTVKTTCFFSSGTMPTGTRIFCQKTTTGGSSSYPTLSPTSTLSDIGATYSNMLLEIGTTFDGNSFTIYPMIEVGSSASTFDPYSGTTHTADLGRTIYGGSVDVVNGSGENVGGKYDLGELTWNADANRSGVFYTSTISGVKTDNCAMVCDSYTVDNSKNPNTIASGEMCSRSSYGGQRIFIKDNSFIGYTGAQVQTALDGKYAILELATPETFTFDHVPIDSKLGNNTLWAEQGSSTEVTYRRDIELALGE